MTLMRFTMLLSLVSCSGVIETSADSPSTPEFDCAQTTRLSTEQVFRGLEKACVGCHGVSAEYPLFGSEQAFRSMVAENARFVVPANPDESVLLGMLDGSRSPSMPPGNTYAQQQQHDTGLPSIRELRCWIEGLDPTRTQPRTDAALNRRITAELLQKNLEWALGLSPANFATSGVDYGLEEPDRTNPASGANQARSRLLGAPNWLNNTARDDELGASFVQVIVQLSQGWCRKAVGSQVFFRHATVNDGTATPASTVRVRLNVAWVFERVTGEPPSNDTLEGLMALFRLYEGVSTRTAWIATCSGVLRHPLSLTY